MTFDRRYGTFVASASRATGLGFTSGSEGLIQAFTIRCNTETREEAERLAALFPKYVKARVSHVSAADDDYYSVNIQGQLLPDGVNAGYNEQGIKRFQTARRTVKKNALPWVWEARFQNSIENEYTFDAECG